MLVCIVSIVVKLFTNVVQLTSSMCHHLRILEAFALIMVDMQIIEHSLLLKFKKWLVQKMIGFCKYVNYFSRTCKKVSKEIFLSFHLIKLIFLTFQRILIQLFPLQNFYYQFSSSLIGKIKDIFFLTLPCLIWISFYHWWFIVLLSFQSIAAWFVST